MPYSDTAAHAALCRCAMRSRAVAYAHFTMLIAHIVTLRHRCRHLIRFRCHLITVCRLHIAAIISLHDISLRLHAAEELARCLMFSTRYDAAAIDDG